jgi:hypothetical protein
VSDLDLEHPAESLAQLQERFPFESPWIQRLGQALCAAKEAGTICDRGSDELRYSRLFGASDESSDLSADAVWMSVPGPHHAHPNGEIDLCFATSGAPSFDGRPPGWTVYPPGSAHVPTVDGGAMMILYLLPGGAISFSPRT